MLRYQVVAALIKADIFVKHQAVLLLVQDETAYV